MILAKRPGKRPKEAWNGRSDTAAKVKKCDAQLNDFYYL